MKPVKILSIVLITILIANLVFFALRMISGALFWLIIMIAAIISYVLVPKLK